MKWLILLLVIILQTACKDKEVEIPEYATHDWYAHYVIDGEEHTIIKDGTDNKEPYLGSYESFGSILSPDGSIKEVTFVYLETYLQTTSEDTDSTMFFSYNISTENKDLIDVKGKTREERLNALLRYFTARQYVFDGSKLNLTEYVDISIKDRLGKHYRNITFSGGPYLGLLNYNITVKKVEVVDHQKYGQVVKVLMHVNATINDDLYGQDHTLTADVQTFFLPPFE